METEIPFSGFYYSIHDQECDHVLSSMFSDAATGCHQYESLVEKAFDLVNWNAVQNGYAKAYVESFSEEFGILLRYKEMVSPKYYNFETDRLFAVIPQSEVERLYKETDTELLKEVIRERFTSRDGFISYYPNDLSEWPSDLARWDANHVGTLLLAYVRQQTDNNFDHFAEYHLIDNPFEVVYNLIHKYSDPEISRLHNIRDYLDKRAERS